MQNQLNHCITALSYLMTYGARTTEYVKLTTNTSPYIYNGLSGIHGTKRCTVNVH
jgi:hypothetical protein